MATRGKHAARRGRGRLPITREGSGKDFVYRNGNRKITRKSEIERIEALAIPPAWSDVEIARSPSANVLARGFDEAGRMQTIYHPSFRRRQDRLKFERLQRFGRALPALRARVDRDLRRRKLGSDRVTACVVHLIDRQFFRVGNTEYAKRYRSFGITTLQREHVSLTNSSVTFDFEGKSGKRQRRRVHDERVARLLTRLGTEMPGSELFRFFDEDDIPRPLRSGRVNDYVKRHMGEEFTAKDFRTWGGTVLVSSALLSADPESLAIASSRTTVVNDAVKRAAELLGNTPAVTKSSYIDPRVLEAVDHPGVLERVRTARKRMRRRRHLSVDEQSTLALLDRMDRALRRG